MLLTNPNLVPGRVPLKVGDWILMEKYGAYVWQGRELSTEEFNSVWKEVSKEALRTWEHQIIVPVSLPEPGLDAVKEERDTWESRAREQRVWTEEAETELFELRRKYQELGSQKDEIATELAAMKAKYAPADGKQKLSKRESLALARAARGRNKANPLVDAVNAAVDKMFGGADQATNPAI